MASEFKMEPLPKRQRIQDEGSFDSTKCIFCMEPFTRNCPVTTADPTKLKSLFDACIQRKDDIGKKILENQQRILDGSISLKYHRNCRSTYVSPLHIKRAMEKHSRTSSVAGSQDPMEASGGGVPFTRSRSSTPTFDWQSNCFICGKKCNPKQRNTWSMVESTVDNNPASQNMFVKMYNAAQQRDDQDMLTRLSEVPNGDLVAIEARYHRTRKNCYASYTSASSLAASKKQSLDENVYKSAVIQLMDEFKSSIIDEREVYLLSTLKERFCTILKEMDIQKPDAYSSQRLKKRLEAMWPEVTFMPQSGRSDLVCSSDITIKDAILKANELAKGIRDVSENAELSSLSSNTQESVNESTIIHKAVGILRREISKCKDKRLKEEYYSSKEMTLKAMRQFVDPLLYQVIGWLTNEDLFKNAANILDSENDAACLAIACDIIFHATAVPSPKHLGLAVHVHQQFGSRKLVEDLYALGYTISYTELLRFLTSAAVHVSSTQQATESGGFIPPEIVSRNNGGKLIVAAGDNWDHNERTVDGKRTTHAMTSILVSPSAGGELAFPRISRVPQRTMDLHSIPGW